jgi:hypothetical protein
MPEAARRRRREARMRVLVAGVLAAGLAAPALAGFSVDFPLIMGLQGSTTRYYTAIDITNNSAEATDVTFEYISDNLTIDVAGMLLVGLPGKGNFHTDDFIQYLAVQGFLTPQQAANTKGTLLLTFTNPGFTTGDEASATVRSYNYVNAGKAPSIGFAYRAIPLRKNGSHTLTSVVSDTHAVTSGLPKTQSHLGLEHVGIDDAGNLDSADVSLRLAFIDPATGAPVGPTPTINLKPGQMKQINDLWRTYGLPNAANSLLVTVTQTAGTAQIRGFVLVKDISTSDLSFYLMQ